MARKLVWTGPHSTSVRLREGAHELPPLPCPGIPHILVGRIQVPWHHRHSLDVEGAQIDGQTLTQPLHCKLAGTVHSIEGQPWGRTAP